MKKTSLVILLVLFVLFLSACEAVPQKGFKPSDDWSRSIQLGEDVIGSIGLSVEGSGERIHLVWPYRVDQMDQIRYTQIDANGEIVQAHDLSFSGQLRTPRLLPSSGGRQHFIWASRTQHRPNWVLQHILLDEDGNAIGRAVPVTPQEMEVGKFAFASHGEGGAVFAWERSGKDEIYLNWLDAEGETIHGPVLISTSGVWPALQVDAAGNIHLAWYDHGSIKYQQISHADFSLSSETNVVTLSADALACGFGEVFGGPVLGTAGDWVVILWSILSISDTEAGTAATEYIAFPAASPALSSPERVWIIATEAKPSEDYQGAFHLSRFNPALGLQEAVAGFGERFEQQSGFGAFVDVTAPSDFVMNPSVAARKNDEVAFAVATSQINRGDTNLEISLILFKDGRYTGYSVASNTGYLSDEPVIGVDEAGNLHLAWREGAGGRQLYYATNAPAAMASLDAIGIGDVINVLLSGSLEGLASIAFLPFIGLGWILPGMILVVVWSLNKDWESVRSPSSWLVLFFAVLLYYGIKLAFMPTISTYIPFSAWMPISPQYHTMLRIAVPALILAISLLAAILISRRYSKSTLVFYLSLTITDALLTLLVYGVTLLGRA